MADPRAQPAGFSSLVGNGLAYAGVDQGIDFTGAGDVYALADGIVTRVKRSGSGWPGEGAVVNYRITSGPAAGRHVYIAEDFAPAVSVGQKIKQGQTLGRATGSGRAPGIEIGWALPSGIPLAPRPAPRPAPQETTAGESFRQFVAGGSSPGAPGGTVGGALNHVPGVVQAKEAVGVITSVPKFIGAITDPHNILRGLQVIAGAVLVLVGTVLLIRQVALANDIDIPAPGRVPLPGTGRDLYQSRDYARGKT